MPIQYTEKRFTVLGEHSKTARRNFEVGYDAIHWPNRPKRPRPPAANGPRRTPQT